MHSFYSEQFDPYYHLATEEYLLKYTDCEWFVLWVSTAAVVVGKHQNVLAEINVPYVRAQNIAVCRRLSGGGTVFHDRGNLNFTFIRQGEKERMIDFARHLEPVLAFLQSCGIDARFSGRNDLLINGLKVSGNAEHVFRNRVLHHGTLLFDADLTHLGVSLRSNAQFYEDRAVKSVRSRVANIVDFLPESLTIEAFKSKMADYMNSYFQALPFALSGDDREAIGKLADEKYRQWDWIYGYSPRYVFRRSLFFLSDDIVIEAEVVKGLFSKLRIEACYADAGFATAVCDSLAGKRHFVEDIVLASTPVLGSVWPQERIREWALQWF